MITNLGFFAGFVLLAFFLGRFGEFRRPAPVRVRRSPDRRTGR